MAAMLELAATISGTSSRPFLAIEGKEVSMLFDNGTKAWAWEGKVPVEGDLDVKMMAKGWNGGIVTLIIARNGKEILNRKFKVVHGVVMFETKESQPV